MWPQCLRQDGLGRLRQLLATLAGWTMGTVMMTALLALTVQLQQQVRGDGRELLKGSDKTAFLYRLNTIINRKTVLGAKQRR